MTTLEKWLIMVCIIVIGVASVYTHYKTTQLETRIISLGLANEVVITCVESLNVREINNHEILKWLLKKELERQGLGEEKKVPNPDLPGPRTEEKEPETII